MSTPGQEVPEDPQELRAAIGETRSELGDTVEALAAKADVKGQAQAKVADAADQARANPAPYLGGAIAALLLLLLVLRRRRS